MPDFSLEHGFLPTPISSIDNYIHAVNAIPMLSAEKEQQLALQWVSSQDTSAARELVLAHLRFVVKIARGFLGYGLSFADLIQEGNIGLMKAVKRFDPQVGVRLVSFAIHWIKAEIHAFVIKNWRIVKVATTKAQRKLFFNLRSLKKSLSWLSSDEVEHIANELDVKPQTVREMELRMVAQDPSFDMSAEDDENGSEFFTPIPADYLQAEQADPEFILERDQRDRLVSSQLIPALANLNPREREIIQLRWMQQGEKVPFKELAKKYGISIERVRQIEAAAMMKLRAVLTQE